MKDNRQRLFEVMGKIDPTFKPSAKLLTEWNFDKKKGEDKEGDEEEETPEHEKSETPAEEKEEHEEKEELKEEDAPTPKASIPVTNWDKAKRGK